MKNKPVPGLRIRYGFIPPSVIALIALILMAAASPMAAVIIAVLSIPLVLLISIRPFLIVTERDARFVSLASDGNFKTITHEELSRRLPGMKWFLRKRDLGRLTAAQNTGAQTGPIAG